MMKRLTCLLAAGFLFAAGIWTPTSAQDAAPKPTVYDRVTSYFEKALAKLPVEQICTQIDRLIATGHDTEQQAQLAGIAFDYYSNAPIMGQEAVAVYVADNYFLNKKLPWSDPETYPLLYTFAEFNRASLIGCDAPEFVMESIDGQTVSLRRDGGHYKLLYFYDPQCATCREYTKAIAELAREYHGGRLSVFTVNTGSDRAQWESYVREHFGDVNVWKVDFRHLWDPEDTNNYHKAYGVLSTPAVVLIDAHNRIIGRRLDPDAAKQLLGAQNFADRETRKLVREVCETLAPVDTATADQIGRTFYAKMGADSTMYRETLYELFNYLRDHASHSYQEAAALIAERYIIAHGDYFSPEYVARVEYALEVFRMNPVGATAPDLQLKDTAGTLHRLLESKAKKRLVVFHIVGCPDCKREFDRIAPLADLYAKKGLEINCIYVGKDAAEWKEFARTHDSRWRYLSDLDNTSGLRDLYDVAFVPKLYLLDRKGKILAKEIDAQTLEELILTKREIAIATGEGEDFYSSIVDYFRARVPGVEVTDGGHLAISRGPSSVNLSNNALILYDGNEIISISELIPSEIHSVEVIQPIEAAIYGIRGGNGVILITSKMAHEAKKAKNKR